MAKLPEDVIEVLRDQESLKFLATVDKEKKLNMVPIGSMTALDEETIAFALCFPDSKTKKNLDATRKAAIAIFKPPFEGFQVKGTFVKWHDSGPMFDSFSALISAVGKEKLGIDIKVVAVGIIKVTEAYALSLPVAGEKIA